MISSFIILVLLIVVPFFIPLDKYKPELESQLSITMGRNVILSSLHLQILPTPALTARGIGIFGAGKNSGEMFVNRLEITPLFHKLLDNELVIQRIHLQGVAINQTFLHSYARQPRAAKDRSRVSIDKISATAVTLRMHDNTLLGPYQFTVLFDSQQRLNLLKIARMDDAATISVTRSNDGYQLYAKAHNWTFPIRTHFHFNNLVAKGQLLHNQIHITNVSAQSYGGSLQGPVTMSWNPQWKIAGRLDVQSISMEPFLRVLKGKGVTGKFNSDLTFDLTAPRFKKLLTAPHIDGEFNITDGMIARNNPARPVFRFDRFTGHGTLEDAKFRVHNGIMETYGGTFYGEPEISWQQGWHVYGKIEAQSIGIKPFLDVFGARGVTGKFSSIATVRLEAPKFNRLIAKPYIDGDFRITAGNISSTDPTHPVFRFDEFSGHGTLDTKQFSTQYALLKAYGGIFSGDPRISWQHEWAAGGHIKADAIDVGQLLAGFNDKKNITGSFTGEADVMLAGVRFFDLLKKPSIDGQFRIKEGVFYKADLEKASTNLSKAGTTGGHTPFKEMRGNAMIKDGRIALTGLKITSAALEANGEIQIDEDKSIDGRMDVGLRKTASLISIPLVVDGTTETPHLRPTNAAVIGGAVGTSVLGPGIGTAIGIKVGKIINKIGAAVTGDKAGDTSVDEPDVANNRHDINTAE